MNDDDRRREELEREADAARDRFTAALTEIEQRSTAVANVGGKIVDVGKGAIDLGARAIENRAPLAIIGGALVLAAGGAILLSRRSHAPSGLALLGLRARAIAHAFDHPEETLLHEGSGGALGFAAGVVVGLAVATAQRALKASPEAEAQSPLITP